MAAYSALNGYGHIKKAVHNSCLSARGLTYDSLYVGPIFLEQEWCQGTSVIDSMTEKLSLPLLFRELFWSTSCCLFFRWYFHYEEHRLRDMALFLINSRLNFHGFQSGAQAMKILKKDGVEIKEKQEWTPTAFSLQIFCCCCCCLQPPYSITQKNMNRWEKYFRRDNTS